MLLSEKIIIKAMSFKYYNSIGYNVKDSKEYFEVDVKDLTTGSHNIVEVSCDYCGDVLSVPYKRYIKYTKVCDKYSCSKKECSNQKIKDVCLIKYGVENPFQAEFVKEKSKNTFIEKYGVEHQMYIQEVKDKIKNTCLEKYGFDHPAKSDIVKKNVIDSNLKKYGVEHPNKLPEQILKMRLSRIENGNQIPDYMVEPYVLYRKKVDNISDRVKKDLLIIWDGYDYYDGEYIRENFNLNPNDKNYPTLDHKISCYYGFLNNISAEEISSVDNLCFTKNTLNCQKGRLTEIEFKNKPQI